MARSRALREAIRALHLAQFCEAHRLPSADCIEAAAAGTLSRQGPGPSRRVP